MRVDNRRTIKLFQRGNASFTSFWVKQDEYGGIKGKFSFAKYRIERHFTEIITH